MQNRPVTAILVGGGHRACVYADYSFDHSDELKIAGVVDPDERRRVAVAEKYGISRENCFETVDELVKKGKIADAIINGTMDNLHVKTSLPLLELGYDMIIEKPFAVNREEMYELKRMIDKHDNKVMVCHVLRYSDFYKDIKKVITDGKIGKILSIQLCEDLSYHHFSTSYIRGKWANSDACGTSVLLAKCCHDIDMMMWLMGDAEPEFVCSTGSLEYFRKENAPDGSGMRCMVDCPYTDSCFMSAKRIYLDMPGRWDHYVWPELHDAPYNEKYEYLKNISPYGRCAYKCNNNVVDHQSVMIKFSNGATGSHNLTAGCAFSQRIVRIIGSLGEINGTFESQKFTVSYVDPHAESDHTDEIHDLSAESSASVGHGGGDSALVADFIKYVRGEATSVSCTTINDSIKGHLVVFAADESMNNNGMPIKTIM